MEPKKINSIVLLLTVCFAWADAHNPTDTADRNSRREKPIELQELVVRSDKHRVLHLLAYVREYSTMSTYSDTVFLFREKMVDFALPAEIKTKFKGWRAPRILKCRSYYRFSDSQGLDSVSDRSRHHFSWSDWMGLPSAPPLPSKLAAGTSVSDTVRGKYSPTEIWERDDDRVSVRVDVLADTTSRRWVTDLSSFFKDNLDFENFRIRYDYDNIADSVLSPLDLARYSFTIESNGRGHDIFRFNRYDEPYFVSTHAEVHILDKEYITVKEARKWEKREYTTDRIYEPYDIAELQPDILRLIDRVTSIEHDRVRLGIEPDRRLMGRGVVRQNFAQRIFSLVKDMTGISSIRANRNKNKQWREFKREQLHKKSRGKNR